MVNMSPGFVQCTELITINLSNGSFCFCNHFAMTSRIKFERNFSRLPSLKMPVSYTHLDVYKRQTWIAGALHGDFGESVFTRNPVSEDLAAYFPTTLRLLLLTLAEIIVFSLLLGVLLSLIHISPRPLPCTFLFAAGGRPVPCVFPQYNRTRCS